MPQEKPPYALNISLEGTRTEHLSRVLMRLNELCGEHDRSSESKTKVVIESWYEDDLIAIREQIELFMRQHKLVLKSECYIKAPTVRPEPEKTPIEEALERLRPEPGSGIDEVILSGGGHETRLKPRTA